MSHREALAAAAVRLEALYEAQQARLAREFPDLPPEQVVDPNGRPILLDALMAIVNARAVLTASQ